MIISIGVDCGIATFCKEHKLRNISLPFDWVVSYNGVSKCIMNNFTDFLVLSPENRINKYDIYFHHHFSHETDNIVDKQHYERRLERIKNILETSEEPIIFCRRGHSTHHHVEHNAKYADIKNDIDDAEELDTFLSEKYPNLKYKIIVIVVCGNCFNRNTKYRSTHERIELHNIVSPQVNLYEFEQLCTSLFSHLPNFT
jgi:hypothetical protein